MSSLPQSPTVGNFQNDFRVAFVERDDTAILVSVVDEHHVDDDDDETSQVTVTETNVLSNHSRSIYRSIGHLGAGSFGKVFLVERGSDKRTFALKAVTVSTPTETENAVAEFNFMQRVSSPHVVQATAHYTFAGKVMIVMEYLDGGTLAQYNVHKKKYCRRFFTAIANLLSDLGIRDKLDEARRHPHRLRSLLRGQRIPVTVTIEAYVEQVESALPTEGKALTTFVQIVVALRDIHRHGILHRDLSSNNVFRHGQRGLIKVGDFGLACYASSEGANDRLVGTSPYRAPEIRGVRTAPYPYSFASDMWAAGVQLVELLTGDPPVDCFVDDILPFLQVQLGHVASPATFELTAALLAKRPEDRPTAQQVLDRWLQSFVNV